MLKLFFVIVLAAVAWEYYSGFPTPIKPAVSTTPTTPVIDNPPAPVAPPRATIFNTSKYKCDGRQHCSQMTSYAEAKFFLNNCPNPKMDGDRDGIPCEDYSF